MLRLSASRAGAARRVHVAVDSTPTARTGPTHKGSHFGRNEFESILGTVFRGGPLSCYDGLFITGVDILQLPCLHVPSFFRRALPAHVHLTVCAAGCRETVRVPPGLPAPWWRN